MLNFRYQLFKHRSLGNVMNFLFPNLNGSLLTIVLGKDIPLKYLFKHIFLSIVWLSLSCDLYDLSSNILLLL